MCVNLFWGSQRGSCTAGIMTCARKLCVCVFVLTCACLRACMCAFVCVRACCRVSEGEVISWIHFENGQTLLCLNRFFCCEWCSIFWVFQDAFTSWMEKKRDDAHIFHYYCCHNRFVLESLCAPHVGMMIYRVGSRVLCLAPCTYNSFSNIYILVVIAGCVSNSIKPFRNVS